MAHKPSGYPAKKLKCGLMRCRSRRRSRAGGRLASVSPGTPTASIDARHGNAQILRNLAWLFSGIELLHHRIAVDLAGRCLRHRSKTKCRSERDKRHTDKPRHQLFHELPLIFLRHYANYAAVFQKFRTSKRGVQPVAIITLIWSTARGRAANARGNSFNPTT
jgi:hypothetical protein